MSGRSESPSARDEWVLRCRRFLKGELAAAEITHAELVQRLSRIGIEESEASIRSKIHRGTYPAWFLAAVMQVCGLLHKRFSDILNGD